MRITPSDIENRKFAVRLRGYDRAAIREFLAEVSEEVASLAGNVDELHRREEELQRSIEEYRAREGAIKETLYAVRGLAEQIKKEAQREADVIVREASLSADKILQQAREQVTRIESDISRLRLERDAFEDRVRLLAEEHLRLIESRHREGEFRDRFRFLGRRGSNAETAPDAPTGRPRETHRAETARSIEMRDVSASAESKERDHS